jgi:hypothetical protein
MRDKQNTWYMPDTGGTHAGSSAPSNTAAIPCIYLSSGNDADYAPAAFTISDLTVDENTAVNYPVAPAGGSFTTTVSGLPSGLSYSLTNISGTAPEVAQFSNVNPSDTYTITVTRTNSFGSTSTTFDIIVNNTTVDTTPISGFSTVSGTTPLVDSDTLDAGSALTIDNSLEQGKRMVFSGSLIQGLYDDTANEGSGSGVLLGVLKSNLSSAQLASMSHSNLDLGFKLWKESGSKYLSFVHNGSVTQNVNFGTGNFTRDLVFFHDTASNKLFVTQNGVTGGTGATMTTPTTIASTHLTPGSSDVDLVLALSSGSSTDVDITTTGISEVDNPAVNTMVTSWNKAIDFSGSNEHLKQANPITQTQPIRLGGYAVAVANNSDSTKTASSGFAMPWASTIVFRIDGNNSNQHIWNMGSGASSNDKNIYLRTDAARGLYFGWGKGSNNNECQIHNYLQTNSTSWYGVYIAHKGGRFNSGDLTAANLAAAHDIRFISTGNSSYNLGVNVSTAANWTTGGNNARTDNSITGDFTIGGRGGNRNFHGKVASMVVTTLKTNDTMPTDAEIHEMITDPVGWVNDYKVGNNYRYPNTTSNYTNFQVGDTQPAYATQVYLMGDGTGDVYSSIKNQVSSNETTYTPLNGQSLVSNDIETVSIPGL